MHLRKIKLTKRVTLNKQEKKNICFKIRAKFIDTVLSSQSFTLFLFY